MIAKCAPETLQTHLETLSTPAAMFGFGEEGTRLLAANLPWTEAVTGGIPDWAARLEEGCWQCRAEKLPQFLDLSIPGDGAGNRWILAPIFDAQFAVAQVLVSGSGSGPWAPATNPPESETIALLEQIQPLAERLLSLRLTQKQRHGADRIATSTRTMLSEERARLHTAQSAAAALTESPLVMIVEDNVVNRMFATATVQALGCTVIEAVNGAQAVVAAAGSSLAAIIMDIEMPILDGLGATRVIRALAAPWNGVPVVGLTARYQPETLNECLDVGMNECLAKPVDPSVLRRVLSQWIPGLHEPPPPSGPPSSGPPLIDEAQLVDLLSSIRPSEVGNIIACFLRDLSARLDRLAQATATRDAAQMAKEAHDLSSTAGSFGARGVMEMASTLEILCRQGAIDEALARMPDVQSAATALMAEMHKRLAARAGG